MELSMLLAQQIVVLFLMMIVGYVIVKIDLLKTEDSDTLAKLVVYIFSPCVIFHSFTNASFNKETFSGFAVAILGAVISFVLLLVTTKICEVVFHIDHIEQASLTYSNCGNLIIPLVSAVLGPEWVFYSSAYLIVSNILFWSHGISVISEEKQVHVMKMIKNPNIIAIIAGLIVFFTHLRLPLIVDNFTTSFGNMIGPASMLNIGILFAGMNLRLAFSNKRAYLIGFGRLIATPLIFIAIIHVCGIMKLHSLAPQILLITLLAASAPCAVNIAQVAQLYHKNSVYASSINVITVIFCLITMPFMVAIYQMVL
ncbi:MAG: AEC family transporter [Lachnospiraceae bacterium]|nr:AEC family transporter [Lachnospiraceae bacterium]